MTKLHHHLDQLVSRFGPALFLQTLSDVLTVQAADERRRGIAGQGYLLDCAAGAVLAASTAIQSGPTVKGPNVPLRTS